MNDPKAINDEAKKYFEELWSHSDPWSLDTSDFEKKRFEFVFSMINDRRYKRVLEIGCGTGNFTRILSTISDEVVAIDISETAIESARNAGDSNGVIEYRVANIMEMNLKEEGYWDLVVMSETIYYLGWLYSFYQVVSVAAELHASTNNEGRLLLANTRAKKDDFSNEMALLAPWLIDTYRDLFLNAGFTREKEQLFQGIKYSSHIDVLIVLYQRKQDDQV